MSISHEDREAAILALATYMAYQPGDTSEVEAWKEDAEGFVDALIALGWEPRSTVSAAPMDRTITARLVARGLAAQLSFEQSMQRLKKSPASLEDVAAADAAVMALISGLPAYSPLDHPPCRNQLLGHEVTE